MMSILVLRRNVYAGLFVVCCTAACIDVRQPEPIISRLRQWYPGAGRQRCEPKRNIVFLKTHKTAGSTIMNIIFRYGTAHNLTFVLPRNHRENYIKGLFHHNNIIDLRPYNLTNNILTHHTRFNKAEITEVMQEDSAYITILRNVKGRFESAYSYYSMEKELDMNLTAFLNYKDLRRIGKLHKNKHMPQNEMSFDLGLHERNYFNATAVKDFIYFLHRTFDLVMIVERLDESLILMKHLLCWTTDDMVALRINARMKEHRVPVTGEMKSRIRELNSADMQLYEHFAKVLDEKVSLFGRSRMKSEVEELKTLRRKHYERCVREEYLAQKIDKRVSIEKVLGFTVKENSDKCRMLTLSQHELQVLLRYRQEKMIQRLLLRTLQPMSTMRVQHEQRRKHDVSTPEDSWA